MFTCNTLCSMKRYFYLQHHVLYKKRYFYLQHPVLYKKRYFYLQHHVLYKKKEFFTCNTLCSIKIYMFTCNIRHHHTVCHHPLLVKIRHILLQEVEDTVSSANSRRLRRGMSRPDNPGISEKNFHSQLLVGLPLKIKICILS